MTENMFDLKFEFILGITVDQLKNGGTMGKHPLDAKKYLFEYQTLKFVRLLIDWTFLTRTKGGFVAIFIKLL